MIFDLMNTTEIVITYSIGLFLLYICIRNYCKMMSTKWMSTPRRKMEVLGVTGGFCVSLYFATPLLIPTTITVIQLLMIA